MIDSHCHLDHPLLAERLDEVLAAAAKAGVHRFIVPGVHPDGWSALAELGHRYPEVFPAPGLHPQHAALMTPSLLARLEAALDTAVAVGEVGLDYRLDVPHRLQEAAFRLQIRLAVTRRLPLLIHCRHAFPDLLRIITEEGGHTVGGVMHAFSGSIEIARECLRLGFMISVAGPITYYNAVKPLAVVRGVPLERLLLETDAPDLTPEPYRGRVNEPSFLPEIAAQVARLKGLPLEEVARATTRNTEELFRLPRRRAFPGES